MIKINCDLCGKVEENLNRAIIEGVELEVCTACSKFGKVIETVKRPSAKEQHRKFVENESAINPKEEKIELIVEDYPELIRKKREYMGLSQKDFAMKVNEKESTVHHIETGKLEPSLEMARKLEKALGIKLVEEHEEKHEKTKARKIDECFTLGDFIKVKNR